MHLFGTPSATEIIKGVGGDTAGATIGYSDTPTTPNNINRKLAEHNPMIAAGLTNVTKDS